MKKYLILFLFIIFYGCKKHTVNYLEDNYEIKLPKNYYILKDTIKGNIDYTVILDLKFNSKKDINVLLNQLKHNSKKNNLEFEMLSKDLMYNSNIKIDTLNRILSFREYHY